MVVIIPIYTASNYDIWYHWTFVSILRVLLISTTPLKFLGEPERYLEYSIIPVFIVLSYFPISEYILIASISLALALLVILYEFLQNRLKKTNHSRGEDMLSLRSWIGEQSAQTVLTIPFRVSFFLGYETAEHHRYLTLFANVGTDDSCRDYKWLLKDWYPFVRNDLDAVIGKFSIDLVVVDKESVQNLERFLDHTYYSFEGFDPLYENSTFQVLRAN